jgi:putative ABC transport system substrate-binding protein
MRRREFITGIAGAAVAWPFAACAQQTVRRVALLLPSHDTDPKYQTRLQALRETLQKLGWMDGHNIRINVSWSGGSSERAQEIAPELVASTPDIIVSEGSVATAAMKRVTSSIAVVFVLVNEPVVQGFVKSLAKPGGNITGFTNMDFTVVGKMVELLKVMVPTLNRIGLMFNSDAYPIYDTYLHTLQTEQGRPVEVVRAAVRSVAEIEPVINTLAALPGSGLAVLPDGGFTITNRATIQTALDRYRLPSIAPFRQFVSEGSLMSYGPDDVDIYRRAADYVNRILKGANPAELPVQQPIKYELVINRKTAKALGLDIPPTVFALADEVIE